MIGIKECDLCVLVCSSVNERFFLNWYLCILKRPDTNRQSFRRKSTVNLWLHSSTNHIKCIIIINYIVRFEFAFDSCARDNGERSVVHIRTRFIFLHTRKNANDNLYRLRFIWLVFFFYFSLLSNSLLLFSGFRATMTNNIQSIEINFESECTENICVQCCWHEWANNMRTTYNQSRSVVELKIVFLFKALSNWIHTCGLWIDVSL